MMRKDKATNFIIHAIGLDVGIIMNGDRGGSKDDALDLTAIFVRTLQDAQEAFDGGIDDFCGRYEKR
jgi:hypothetical protein